MTEHLSKQGDASDQLLPPGLQAEDMRQRGDGDREDRPTLVLDQRSDSFSQEHLGPHRIALPARDMRKPHQVQRPNGMTANFTTHVLAGQEVLSGAVQIAFAIRDLAQTIVVVGEKTAMANVYGNGQALLIHCSRLGEKRLTAVAITQIGEGNSSHPRIT